MKSWVKVCALVATLVALAFAAACADGNSLNPGQGNVRVMLTADTAALAAATGDSSAGVAAPGSTGEIQPGTLHDDDDDDDGDGDSNGPGGDILSRLAAANATISTLEAINLDGTSVDLAIELPQTVDLIALARSGAPVELPIGTLPPGTYDKIFVVITQLELVFLNGGKITLDPPGSGWARVVPVQAFEVIEGAVITIELQFRPQAAFRDLGGEFGFFPNFECRRWND